MAYANPESAGPSPPGREEHRGRAVGRHREASAHPGGLEKG